MKLRYVIAVITAVVCAAQAAAVADPDPNDPFEADSVLVRPYCTVVAGPPWPDSIGVPIEIWADDDICIYSVGLTISGPATQYLNISSVDHGPCDSEMFTSESFPPGDSKTVIFSWTDFIGTEPCESPQGLLATVYLQVDPEAPPGIVANLDSTWVPPAGRFYFLIYDQAHVQQDVTPQFDNGSSQGLPNIVLGESSCGDANNNGTLDMSDAIYMVNYIFGLGDPPQDSSGGDINCDGRISMSDIVRLIWYLFANGNSPCDSDGDGTADC